MCEIVKQEKEIRASFAVTPQTARLTATVRGRCLVRMEKASQCGGRHEQKAYFNGQQHVAPENTEPVHRPQQAVL